MLNTSNSLQKDLAIRLMFTPLDRRNLYCNVLKINLSFNFILSNGQCKSNQNILEGVAYE